MKNWGKEGKKLVVEYVNFFTKKPEKFSQQASYIIDLETGKILKNRYNNSQADLLKYILDEYKTELSQRLNEKQIENLWNIAKL